MPNRRAISASLAVVGEFDFMRRDYQRVFWDSAILRVGAGQPTTDTWDREYGESLPLQIAVPQRLPMADTTDWGRLRKRNLKYVKHAPRLAPSGIVLERTRRDFWSRPWAERSPSESFDAKTSAVHF